MAEVYLAPGESVLVERRKHRPLARRADVQFLPGKYGNTVTADTVADTVAALEAGRRHVAEDGFIQDSLWNLDGVCTVGAMLADDQECPSLALYYLGRAAGVPPGAVDEWNDATGRTQAEVLDAYDHAIKYAREDREAGRTPQGQL